MAEATIPVDLLNPGQVFACLGFLEAADILLGDARGGFDWSDESDVCFRLAANGNENPFRGVLKHLASANVIDVEPLGWPAGHNASSAVTNTFPSGMADHFVVDKKTGGKWSRTKLPAKIRFGGDQKDLDIYGWCDGSGRSDFKLYAGNRSGAGIASEMLFGKRGKPTRTEPAGALKTKGLRQLFDDSAERLVDDPFSVLTQLAGSFNMDPRGAWKAMDIGYSIDQHRKIFVVASPVVEILAVFGVEHSRPIEIERRTYKYGTWATMLPPSIARVAMSGIETGISIQRYTFRLDLSGKNKIVTFATSLI